MAGCSDDTNPSPADEPAPVSPIAAQNGTKQADAAKAAFGDAAAAIGPRPKINAINCAATAMKEFSCNARLSADGNRIVHGVVVDGVAKDVKVLRSGAANPGAEVNGENAPTSPPPAP